jgi:hypothetical protein
VNVSIIYLGLQKSKSHANAGPGTLSKGHEGKPKIIYNKGNKRKKDNDVAQRTTEKRLAKRMLPLGDLETIRQRSVVKKETLFHHGRVGGGQTKGRGATVHKRGR